MNDELVTEEQMTAKQIANWRKVLLASIGPYALLMPDKQVQLLRNKFQAHFQVHLDYEEENK